MKIGMVLGAPFPPDIRVAKESKALVNAGFDVHLLCTAEHDKPSLEVIKGIKIHRANMPYGNTQAKFWNILAELIFVHPLWLKNIHAFVKDNQIQILHVHDLPLVNTALKAKRFLKIPVIADLHENYPAAIQVWNNSSFDVLKVIKSKTINKYTRWIAHEKKVCAEVDHIIVVIDEMKDRLVRTHSLSPGKITVVINTEDPEFIKSANYDAGLVERYEKNFIISYIGGFGPHRGLATAIKGMSIIAKEIHEALLLIVGKGNHRFEGQLKGQVKELGLERNVKMLGWQPLEKVYTYMTASNIGIIPHEKSEHTDNTIPHKLFQYMMVGKPLIVSNCTPLKRIVETHQCGTVFETDNHKSFAKRVIELYNDLATMKKLGENGRKATLNGTLNWDYTAGSLVNVYKTWA